LPLQFSPSGSTVQDNQNNLTRSPTPNVISPVPSVAAQPQSSTSTMSTVSPAIANPVNSISPAASAVLTSSVDSMLQQRPSPPVTPAVSVCTPAGSPSPTPVFDLPGSGTPTPPPKPATPINTKESEVKVKLEIPEFQNTKQSSTTEAGGSIEARRLSKQSKLKPDPISINNDVVVNHPVTSPLNPLSRGLLPSLNTPMFLTSPMFGQRTPLLPGIHFWGPGTLSPVSTLSPRFGGLHAGPAFQFPAFAVSPSLASFSSFHDSVFTNAPAPNSTSSVDKKVS